VEEKSKTNRMELLNSAFYTPKERDILINGTEKEKGVFSGLKGFERELEKEEFLNQASVFKGTLRDLGKLNSYNFKKAVKFAAMLKSSGAKSGEDAVKAVNSFLSGEGDELFDLLKNTWRFGDKYTEDAKKAWQSGAEVDLESRITKMVEMSNDYESLGFTKKADTKEEIDSNLASAEQTLSNLTTSVLDPLIKFINMVTKYFNDFTFQTHVIEPFFKGLKSLFAKLPYIGWAFEDNPNPPKNKNKNNDTGGPPPPSPTPFGGNSEDNNNNTP
uniref:DUF759 family protein n=1 Tax=Borreliella bavariensis TaxID=664662 RepID=UPI001C007C89